MHHIYSQLGEMCGRLRSIDERLMSDADERKAIWKKLDTHSESITSIKTKHGIVSGMIATIISILVGTFANFMRWKTVN